MEINLNLPDGTGTILDISPQNSLADLIEQVKEENNYSHFRLMCSLPTGQEAEVSDIKALTQGETITLVPHRPAYINWEHLLYALGMYCRAAVENVDIFRTKEALYQPQEDGQIDFGPLLTLAEQQNWSGPESLEHDIFSRQEEPEDFPDIDWDGDLHDPKYGTVIRETRWTGTDPEDTLRIFEFSDATIWAFQIQDWHFLLGIYHAVPTWSLASSICLDGEYDFRCPTIEWWSGQAEGLPKALIEAYLRTLREEETDY